MIVEGLVSKGQNDSAIGAERVNGIWRELEVRAKFLDSVNIYWAVTVCQAPSHNISFQGRQH